MRHMLGRKSAIAALTALAALCALLVSGPAPDSTAADHRDGPIFGNTQANGTGDINDIYVFRSPANANNTVLVFTFQPFPGNLTPATVDPAQQYDVRIDTNGDFIEELTFRVTYGAPDLNGVQDVTLRGLPAARFPPTGILARGKTGQNFPIAGGGMFRSAIQDDPFFFDAAAFNTLLNGGAYPRPVGQAKNFFGPNVNTFAFVIELPSSRIAANGALIRTWGTLTRNGVQIDRMGRPAINTALIPPVPRGANFPIGQGGVNRQERRNVFNASLPRNDVATFKADMVSVLTNFYGRTAADADAISGLLLPDVLPFEIGNANGFGTFIGPGGSVLGNGRRLRDDVIDFEVTVLTNGAITTDNTPDDNGTKITDGNMGTVAAFPYIGPANLPLNGPGTGPNP